MDSRRRKDRHRSRGRAAEGKVEALSMHTFLQAGVIQAMLVTRMNVQETTITGLPHKAH